MLQDFILQTTNTPGVGSCTLIPAATGRRNFSQAFATGASCFYYLDDSTQAEWGYGVLTTGSPDTMSRDTVIGNTLGTTARLNFTAMTRIYNEVPAANMVYRDKLGVVTISEPGNGINTLTITAASDVNGANIKLIGNGASTPNKTLRVISGQFQVINSAYTAAIFTISDDGSVTIPKTLTATSLNITGTTTLSNTTSAASILLNGADSGGVQLRATHGNYGVMLLNDGANGYLLSTASGNQLGTCNSYRPFYWNLPSGAVVIDGGGSGTSFGGLVTANAGISATTVTCTNPINSKGIGIGGVGLSPGGLFNTGYLAFFDLFNTRSGYIGYGAAGAPLNFVSENGHTGWQFDKTLTVPQISVTNSGTGPTDASVHASGYISSEQGFFSNGPMSTSANMSCVSFGTSQFATIGTSLAVGDVISSLGYKCRTGSAGALTSNVFNFYWASGTVYAYIDNSQVGNFPSDGRYKHDIKSLPDTGLSRILQLAPKSFRWQDKGIFSDDEITREGLIAQDVKEIIPSAVQGDEDNENHVLSLTPLPLIAVLVKATQEIAERLSSLEAAVKLLQ